MIKLTSVDAVTLLTISIKQKNFFEQRAENFLMSHNITDGKFAPTLTMLYNVNMRKAEDCEIIINQLCSC